MVFFFFSFYFLSFGGIFYIYYRTRSVLLLTDFICACVRTYLPYVSCISFSSTRLASLGRVSQSVTRLGGYLASTRRRCPYVLRVSYRISPVFSSLGTLYRYAYLVCVTSSLARAHTHARTIVFRTRFDPIYGGAPT